MDNEHALGQWISVLGCIADELSKLGWTPSTWATVYLLIYSHLVDLWQLPESATEGYLAMTGGSPESFLGMVTMSEMSESPH